MNELYVVALAGGSPRKLNSPLPPEGDVKTFEFSLDSQSVLYLADQEVDHRQELYRVPVTGGAAHRLSGTLVPGGQVRTFTLDPDGQRIVYIADQQTVEKAELYSVSINGGGLANLNGAMSPASDVTDVAVDPVTDSVVYIADKLLNQRFELFSVPLTGGASTRLNPTLASDADVYGFAIDQAAPLVVFLAQESGASAANLWSVVATGGTPKKLNITLAANDRILNYGISPAGDRVVYNVATSDDVLNQGLSDAGKLYSTAIGGTGGSVPLTETPDPYYGVQGYRFTPDGARIVYEFQRNALSAGRLESSSAQTGARATLYEPSSSGPPVYDYALSDNSQLVVVETQNGLLGNDLSAVPIGGGSALRYGPGNLQSIMPDSSRVLFRRLIGPSVEGLLSVQIDGSDERELSGMQSSGSIYSTVVSPDSTWIVFIVQIGERFEVRVSDGRAAQAPETPTSPAPTAPPHPGGHRTMLPLAQR